MLLEILYLVYVIVACFCIIVGIMKSKFGYMSEYQEQEQVKW